MKLTDNEAYILGQLAALSQPTNPNSITPPKGHETLPQILTSLEQKHLIQITNNRIHYNTKHIINTILNAN